MPANEISLIRAASSGNALSYQKKNLCSLPLQSQYHDSKLYPMFPRYNLLKEMIKEVTHHPDYMEHRHESRYSIKNKNSFVRFCHFILWT